MKNVIFITACIFLILLQGCSNKDDNSQRIALTLIENKLDSLYLIQKRVVDERKDQNKNIKYVNWYRFEPYYNSDKDILSELEQIKLKLYQMYPVSNDNTDLYKSVEEKFVNSIAIMGFLDQFRWDEGQLNKRITIMYGQVIMDTAYYQKYYNAFDLLSRPFTDNSK